VVVMKAPTFWDIRPCSPLSGTYFILEVPCLNLDLVTGHIESKFLTEVLMIFPGPDECSDSAMERAVTSSFQILAYSLLTVDVPGSLDAL
jgi:hypothetical protein